MSKENQLFAANLDGEILDAPEAIEAKFVTMDSPTLGAWGANGTEDVPDHVMCQVQHQMFCADLEKVHVVALLAGKYRLYHIKRDQELIDYQVGYCEDFWERYVVPEIMPDHSMPAIETLQRVKRLPKSARKIVTGKQLIID